MKAIVCNEYGPPSSLAFEQIDPPKLGHTDVRIAIHAAGVNYFETLMISGNYQERRPLPFVPGAEVAGEIIEVGPGAHGLKVGDRVLGMINYGGYAEEAVTNAMLVRKIPDSMDYVSAAAFPINYGTAHVGLTHRARLQPGETLVVFGAAGGVGLCAVEIGKRLGATVIACASTDEKLELTKQYGASYTINYTTEDLKERIRAITGGNGADVFFDPVGGDALETALRCINWEGRLIVVGFTSGRIPQIPANIPLVKNCSIVGLFWGAYMQKDPAILVKSIDTLLEWYDNNNLKPHVSAILPLEKAPEAMEMLINRQSTGKVVLTTSHFQGPVQTG